MMQQVNLLPKHAQDKGTLLQNPYLLLSLAVGVLLLIISGFDAFRISQLNQQHAQMETQLQSSTSRLTALQTRFSQQKVDDRLIQELKQTQQYYQSLSQIVELLSDNRSDHARGFSRYFEALADQSQRDIWLTHIQIDNLRNDISLQGSTFQAESIPALLQRLKNSPAFNGRHFARLLIQQNPDQTSQADFNVSSSLKSKEDADNAQ